MTVNKKPQIEAHLVTRIKGQGYGKPRKVLDAKVYDATSDGFFAKGAKENYTVEPLVPLSTYETLQAENESLCRDMSVLVEALELISDVDPDDRPGTEWFHEIADKALVAARKQRGES